MKLFAGYCQPKSRQILLLNAYQWFYLMQFAPSLFGGEDLLYILQNVPQEHYFIGGYWFRVPRVQRTLRISRSEIPVWYPENGKRGHSPTLRTGAEVVSTRPSGKVTVFVTIGIPLTNCTVNSILVMLKYFK